MLEALEKIIAKKTGLVVDKAIVEQVGEDTCQVKSLTTGKTYFKCALNAVTENGDSQLKVTPEAGSEVCIGILPDKSAFILSVSRAGRIYYKNGTTELTADANGFKLEREGENVFTCLSDMIDELNKILVINGTTINVAAMMAIKQRFNTVLTE